MGWKTGPNPATTPARPATANAPAAGRRIGPGGRGSGSASRPFRQGGIHFRPGHLRDRWPLAPADTGEGFSHAAAAQLRRPVQGLVAAGGGGDGVEHFHSKLIDAHIFNAIICNAIASGS